MTGVSGHRPPVGVEGLWYRARLSMGGDLRAGGIDRRDVAASQGAG